MSECGENLTPGLDGDDVTKRIQITGRVDDLRTRIAAVKFHLANWLFRKLDRWLDHYLDGLSEERLEKLYQQAVRVRKG